MTVTPISPLEALAASEKAVPEQVFEAFNELLAEKLSRGRNRVSATFTESAVVARIVAKGISRSELYERNWLEVKSHYGKKGWTVDRDRPGFNESYEATFSFTADVPGAPQK
jgi:hypothetical protein